MWDRAGDAGAEQLTPNLSTIVQEIVNQTDWESGNAIVIVATVEEEHFGGQRVAVARDGSRTNAPLLTIDYTHGLIGDLNGDGVVEFADFLILSDSFGEDVDPPGTSGDINSDGRVDFTDFLILSDHFSDNTAGSQSVPEPSYSIIMCLCGLVACHHRLNRRERRLAP